MFEGLGMKNRNNHDGGGTYAPVAANNTDDDDDNNNNNMQENLIGPAPGTKFEAQPATPLMEVTAPATLSEGYVFPITLHGQQYNVQVPMGGVEVGQKFYVPIPGTSNNNNQRINDGGSSSTTTASSANNIPISIPVGHWRDEIWGIFNYGICHAHCWTSIACSLLAGGQVIRRLHFSWRGTPAPDVGHSAQAFQIIIYITIFHWFMIAMLYVAIFFLDPNDYSEPEPEDGWDEPEGFFLLILVLFDIFKYLYMGITIGLLFNLRKSVRDKYAIPGNDCEDFCCTFWCPCLIAGQMLRHTTDYNIYPSQLWTDTGLSPSAPEIV